MNSKPSLRLFVHLIHDLEDGPFLQEIVADLALKISKNFKEFKTIHLRAPHELLQGIGQGRLQFDQRLYRLLIGLLEIWAVNIRKILAFEFID